MFDFYHRVLGCTIDEPIEEHVNRFGGALTHLRAGSCYIDLLAYDSNHLTNEGKEAASRMHAGGVGLGDKRLEDVQLSAETSTLDHVCLRVDSFDQQRMVAYLEGESVEIVGMGDRLGADGVGPSVYLRDPEGNVLELKGAPLNRDQTEVKEPTNASQEMRRSDDKSNAVSSMAGAGEEPLEDDETSADVPATPCNRICRYNADFFDGAVCVGCFREAFEIAAWQSMTPEQKSFTLMDAMDRCSESKSFDGAISMIELTRQQKYWAEKR